MNWGYKIMLVYILFAAGILTLVFKAKSEKVDLVAKDYYAQEVAYQNRLDAITNASALSGKAEVMQTSDGIVVQLPKECALLSDGNIVMYRPSDSRLDKTISLNLDTAATQVIPRKELEPGLYTFKVEWQYDGKPYYAENALIVEP